MSGILGDIYLFKQEMRGAVVPFAGFFEEESIAYKLLNLFLTHETQQTLRDAIDEGSIPFVLEDLPVYSASTPLMVSTSGTKVGMSPLHLEYDCPDDSYDVGAVSPTVFSSTSSAISASPREEQGEHTRRRASSVNIVNKSGNNSNLPMTLETEILLVEAGDALLTQLDTLFGSSKDEAEAKAAESERSATEYYQAVKQGMQQFSLSLLDAVCRIVGPLYVQQKLQTERDYSFSQEDLLFRDLTLAYSRCFAFFFLGRTFKAGPSAEATLAKKVTAVNSVLPWMCYYVLSADFDPEARGGSMPCEWPLFNVESVNAPICDASEIYNIATSAKHEQEKRYINSILNEDDKVAAIDCKKLTTVADFVRDYTFVSADAHAQMNTKRALIDAITRHAIEERNSTALLIALKELIRDCESVVAVLRLYAQCRRHNNDESFGVFDGTCFVEKGSWTKYLVNRYWGEFLKCLKIKALLLSLQDSPARDDWQPIWSLYLFRVLLQQRRKVWGSSVTTFDNASQLKATQTPQDFAAARTTLMQELDSAAQKLGISASSN